MQRTGPFPTAGKAFETVVWTIVALAACYLLVGAYYGFAVGRAMHEAKTANPVVAMVATAIGRDNAEQFAILKMKVPTYVVKAPTFWFALRMNE
jgi:hypothetical protein